MVKKNKAISSWFSSKSPQEQAKLMKVAAEKKQEAEDDHRKRTETNKSQVGEYTTEKT